MKIIIPSFDRACQLQLLLDSLVKNWHNLNLSDCIVLYRASDRKYKEGYLLLNSRFPQVNFWNEDQEDVDNLPIGFYSNLMQFIYTNEYVGFMVDDGIFYRPCSLTTGFITDQLNDQDNLFISLRLGTNTIVQNYLTNEEQTPIEEYGLASVGFGLHQYRWPCFGAHTNNGYMFSWDCTFWRSEDLKHYLEDKYFDGPRGMEAILSDPRGLRKEYFLKHSKAVIPYESHYVVNSVNAVQKDPVPCGKFFSFSPSHLNDIYLSGNVIDLDDFLSKCKDINSCHTEIPFTFRKYE